MTKFWNTDQSTLLTRSEYTRLMNVTRHADYRHLFTQLQMSVARTKFGFLLEYNQNNTKAISQLQTLILYYV